MGQKLTNAHFVHIYTDRTIQRSTEAKAGIDDLFTKGIISLVDHIRHQLVDNRAKLGLTDDFCDDDVLIKITDGRKDELSSVGDVYIELTATLISNGEVVRLNAAKKLVKIVRHHFKDAGVSDDLRINANIIRIGVSQ